MIVSQLQRRAALMPTKRTARAVYFTATRPLMLRGPPRFEARSFSQGFTSAYDPDERGRGPIFERLVPRAAGFYPRDLKKLLDDYVVGQDRAKKTICSIVFNHAQKISYRKYLAEQIRDRDEKEARQAAARERRLAAELHGDVHRDVYPPTHPASHTFNPRPPKSGPGLLQKEDPLAAEAVKIDKSNMLLLGPTGSGKTYILETLSKQLKMPFTITDCNTLTQAGYIGQDVESCIERLLVAANFDVEATERGIVVLDEFDKLAKKPTTSGRDVSGEGVQQALLKLLEGTKVTVQLKGEGRSSRGGGGGGLTYAMGPGGPIGGGGGGSGPPPPLPPGMSMSVAGRGGEVYTIDTTNILFVLCGAFVGLQDLIVSRTAKTTMGFGAKLKSAPGADGRGLLPTEAYAHLPHQPEPAVPVGGDETSPSRSSPRPQPPPSSSNVFTPLDLASPEDLQRMGFIPEIIGRCHNLVALSPLSVSDLVRILTEPRDNLVRQYTMLFKTYPSELRFTKGAVRAIAERAARLGTGARGLKMEVERVLAEPMFDAPIPFVLVTEAAVAEGPARCEYWAKDGRVEWARRAEEEDAREEERERALREKERGAGAAAVATLDRQQVQRVASGSSG